MRILLILTLLFVSVLPLSAQKNVCIFCHGDTMLETLDYVDGPKTVCQLCQKKYPKCDVCHLTTNLPRYRDGRYFCPSCQKIGVFTDSAASGLQQEVLTFLNAQLGAATLPPIRMCDKDELQTRHSEHGRSLDVIGFYAPYNPEMVYLLTGEPAVELQSVMAHEYTHAWQSRNCKQQDRAVTEGFASLVCYKWLLKKGLYAKAEALTRHSDPDYGASLVSLLAREKRIGWKPLVEWVKTAQTLNS